MPIATELAQKLSESLERWNDASKDLWSESVLFVSSIINSGDQEALVILSNYLDRDEKAIIAGNHVVPEQLAEILNGSEVPRDDEAFYASEYYGLVQGIIWEFDEILPNIENK